MTISGFRLVFVCVFFPLPGSCVFLHHPRVPAPGDSLVLAGASRTWWNFGGVEGVILIGDDGAYLPLKPATKKWNVNENCLGYVVQVGIFHGYD